MVACSEVPPTGVQCAEADFKKRGRPLMLAQQNDIAFGVSSRSTEPSELFIWMDNRTEQTQSYGMRCRVSFLGAFVAYDSAGKRLLSAAERRGRQLHSPMDEGEVCSCCIVVSIPPHTMQVVDYGNLSEGYRLSPGSYFVIPAYPRKSKTNLPAPPRPLQSPPASPVKSER
jgi:hypothetical protein